MVEPLQFHPRVAEDLANASRWYDEISIEVGDRFRQAVDSRLDSVERHPKSYGLLDDSIRAARVAKFPYVVVFESFEESTEVLGYSILLPIRKSGDLARDKARLFSSHIQQ